MVESSGEYNEDEEAAGQYVFSVTEGSELVLASRALFRSRTGCATEVFCLVVGDFETGMLLGGLRAGLLEFLVDLGI